MGYLRRALEILLLFSLQGFSCGLKLTETVIPSYGVLKQPVTLYCNFNLQNDTLYALKWYKDGHEFYRYKPSDEPPVTVFPVPGVSVNVNSSGLTSLKLDEVTFLTRGTFKCEISADSPSFQTLYEERYMRILALPLNGLSISGTLPWYNLGDNFSSTCNIERTFPPPHLSWLINDVQIDNKKCDCVHTETSEAGKAIDGSTFYTTRSIIKFQLDAHYFRDGSLTAECKAAYTKTDIELYAKVQSNIKAGLGLRQYASNLFSGTSRTAASFSLSAIIILVYIYI